MNDKKGHWELAPTPEEKERVEFLWVKIGELLDKESLNVSLLTVSKLREELFDLWIEDKMEGCDELD